MSLYQKEIIFVFAGEYKYSSDLSMSITTGSCVSLLLVLNKGIVASHCFNDRDAYMLTKEMIQKYKIDTIKAMIIGGGCQYGGLEKSIQLGIDIIKAFLESHNIPLVHVDTGGKSGRIIEIYPEDNKITIRKIEDKSKYNLVIKEHI